MIYVMVDSASRPHLLERTLTSLKTHFKYSGELYWIHYETFLDEQKSMECLELAQEFGMNKILENHDPKGECVSIGRVLNGLWKTVEYFIHWEDDYVALRDIDLDLCYKLMETNPLINQIAFNRRRTMPEISTWRKKEFCFGEQIMTSCPHWRFCPAMWRLSFIKDKWKSFEGENGHWRLNDVLQKGFQPNKTADLVAEKLGTFYLGPIGELAYCKHIGKGQSNRIPGT
jgi:hypothetical protein